MNKNCFHTKHFHAERVIGLLIHRLSTGWEVILGRMPLFPVDPTLVSLGGSFSPWGCRTRSPYGPVRKDATDLVDRGGQSLDLLADFLDGRRPAAPRTLVRQTVRDGSNEGDALQAWQSGLRGVRIVAPGYGRSTVIHPLSARMGLQSRPDNARVTLWRFLLQGGTTNCPQRISFPGWAVAASNPCGFFISGPFF